MPSTSSAKQSQPRNVSETTALLKSSTSTSLSTSIRSASSLSELSLISSISSFQISRHNRRLCCNFTRDFHVRDCRRKELLLVATQENGCFTSDDEYEDIFIYDLHDQLTFSIEFEETRGYLSTQMKFSVVSSTKIGIGSVSRIWSFMDLPRYEILNWDGAHLFSVGPPKTSGIRCYDFKREYEVISKDGKSVAKVIQEGRNVTIKFDASSEPFQLQDKTLILSLGFILDLLRNE